jgi:hypothetical protein
MSTNYHKQATAQTHPEPDPTAYNVEFETGVSICRELDLEVKRYSHLNGLHHFHSFDNLPEDNMFSVKPAGSVSANEKLGAIRVGP